MTGTPLTTWQRIGWARRAFLFGLIGFFLPLAVCVVMRPESLTINQGFSYFGNYPDTLALYRLGVGIIGVCMVIAAIVLPQGNPFGLMRLALILMFPLLVGIARTTMANNPYIELHHRFGIGLFAVQGLLAIGLGLVLCRDRWNIAWLVLLLAGALVSAVSLSETWTWQIEGQIAFQLSFGVISLRSLGILQRRFGGE